MIEKTVLLQPHQTLGDLAYIFYGDSNLWRVIADANPNYHIFHTNYTQPIEINIPENATR